MSKMGPVDLGALKHKNVHPRGARTVVDRAEQGHKPSQRKAEAAAETTTTTTTTASPFGTDIK